MDNDLKTILACLVLMFLVFFIFVLGAGHDGTTITNANDEANYQYFIQSENMTNEEKYDLAHSICNCTFNNETFMDSLWFGRLHRTNIKFLTNDCINDLIY